MTIYNQRGDKCNPVGPKDYWEKFSDFEGSPLHKLFVEELRPYLSMTDINSATVGGAILSKVEKEQYSLLRSINRDDRGEMNGMTIWNHLEQLNEDWTLLNPFKGQKRPKYRRYRKGRHFR